MSESENRFDDDALSRMLASIDHPLPPLDISSVMRRARVRSGRRSALLAAAAVVLVAGVATATVPGSFGRRYLERWLDRRAPHAQSKSELARGAAAGDAASRGIAFAPGAQVDIDFKAEQTSGALQVRWADVATVMLAQTGSQGEAHYALTPDGVIVDNAGSHASYSLVVPRTLARVRVRVAGKIMLSKEGQTISCGGVREDTGSCVIEVGPRQPQ